MDFPETPEGIALILLAMILERRREAVGVNFLLRKEIIPLYGQCLRIARDRRNITHDLPRITDTIH